MKMRVTVITIKINYFNLLLTLLKSAKEYRGKKCSAQLEIEKCFNIERSSFVGKKINRVHLGAIQPIYLYMY